MCIQINASKRICSFLNTMEMENVCSSIQKSPSTIYFIEIQFVSDKMFETVFMLKLWKMNKIFQWIYFLFKWNEARIWKTFWYSCLMKSCQLLCLKIEIVSKFPIIKFQCLFDEAILGCLQKLKHFEWWNKTYIRMFQPFLWGYASMNVDKKFKTG